MPDTPKIELTPEQRLENTAKLRQLVVQQATIEVMRKHQDEILAVARQRLNELGLTLPDEVVK